MSDDTSEMEGGFSGGPVFGDGGSVLVRRSCNKFYRSTERSQVFSFQENGENVGFFLFRYSSFRDTGALL
jgi:hypothetical protein